MNQLQRTEALQRHLKGETMTNTLSLELIAYLADYINEEIARGATIDKYTITEAILSFEGGAGDDSNDY